MGWGGGHHEIVQDGWDIRALVFREKQELGALFFPNFARVLRVGVSKGLGDNRFQGSQLWAIGRKYASNNHRHLLSDDGLLLSGVINKRG